MFTFYLQALDRKPFSKKGTQNKNGIVTKLAKYVGRVKLQINFYLTIGIRPHIAT